MLLDGRDEVFTNSPMYGIHVPSTCKKHNFVYNLVMFTPEGVWRSPINKTAVLVEFIVSEAK